MIPPKRFDISPLTEGCSEGLDAFRFFFKYKCITFKYGSRFVDFLHLTYPLVANGMASERIAAYMALRAGIIGQHRH